MWKEREREREREKKKGTKNEREIKKEFIDSQKGKFFQCDQMLDNF